MSGDRFAVKINPLMTDEWKINPRMTDTCNALRIQFIYNVTSVLKNVKFLVTVTDYEEAFA